MAHEIINEARAAFHKEYEDRDCEELIERLFQAELQIDDLERTIKRLSNALHYAIKRDNK